MTSQLILDFTFAKGEGGTGVNNYGQFRGEMEDHGALPIFEKYTSGSVYCTLFIMYLEIHLLQKFRDTSKITDTKIKRAMAS